ncbi:hypothetical protein HYS28_03820 [Candidatus Uhrbacteria bacterium]|nr:hypothetical protein [Candidatus Uhrbacteria bacterium]
MKFIRRPFFLFLVLYLLSAAGLQYVTGIIEAAGGTVPDLIVFATMEEAKSAFDALERSGMGSTYLWALWTLDVLFPIAYAGVITHIAPRGIWRGNCFVLASFTAMIDTMAENTAATVLLLVREEDVTSFMLSNRMKWALLCTSLSVAVVTRVIPSARTAYAFVRRLVAHPGL